MGITGLLPFLEKASRKTNVSEFSGCTVAVDAYCWLHKGVFACADKLARGEETDIHIKYCMKYVTMLLSKNIKPILVFDGQRLPAKAHTEAKRRESRMAAKKRAVELLKLGKSEEALAHMRRSVDVTHAMALALMAAARARHVDCVTAPYEADAQLAYLATRGFAHLVISEDSDLILFGCERVLYKMDVEGAGTLVETGGGGARLARALRCGPERASLARLRHMCILAGCDYLPSLPGVGLARARQFVLATHDPDIANALKKLPGFLKKPSLPVTEQYRGAFLRADATFKHQFVYDPCARRLTRLLDPLQEGTEEEVCSECGAALEARAALQLCLGNLDPNTLQPVHNWQPDTPHTPDTQTHAKPWNSWKECPRYPSIWSQEYARYLKVERPWQKKKQEPAGCGGGNSVAALAPAPAPARRLVRLAPRIVPETQDDSVTIESLSSMYCVQPANKKNKLDPAEEVAIDSQHPLNRNISESQVPGSPPRQRSPILQSRNTFRKSILSRLSRFPRTTLEQDRVESKFFCSGDSGISDVPDSMDSSACSQKENDSSCQESVATDLDEVHVLDRKLPLSEVTNSDNRGLTSDADADDESLRWRCRSAPGGRAAAVETVAPFQATAFLNGFRRTDEGKLSRNPFRVRNEDGNTSGESLDKCGGGEGAVEKCGGAEGEGEGAVETGCETQVIATSSPPLESAQITDSLDWPLKTCYLKLANPVSCEIATDASRPDNESADSLERRAGAGAGNSAPCGARNRIAGGLKGARGRCRAPGLPRAPALPSNQPTLLASFAFHNKAVLRTRLPSQQSQ